MQSGRQPIGLCLIRKLFLALWLSMALGVGEAAAANLVNAETATLPHGLEIVVIANHRAPLVSHMVWYKVGSADEVPGKTGIAHFLEPLMFKGTASLPA